MRAVFSARARAPALEQVRTPTRPAAVIKPTNGAFIQTHTPSGVPNYNLQSVGTLSPDAATQLKSATELVTARNSYARVMLDAEAAESSGNYTAFTKDTASRERLMAATSNALTLVKHHDRPIKQLVTLLRSRHPDRAQANVNPSRIAAAAQPAIKQSLLSKEQVETLTSIARRGINLHEIRDLQGPSLDLSSGNAKDPLDHEVLLDFYFEQAFKGRVLIFPDECEAFLDSCGEIILSPSFLVRVPGKKPRCILNLSSTEFGVNQRLQLEPEAVPASKLGYATIPGVAKLIIDLFVKIVTRPQEYNIKDITEMQLVMIVMDGDAAFFRWPISAESAGIQATKIAAKHVLPTACCFGAGPSAINFSHVTEAIQALHRSDLGSATLLGIERVSQDLHPKLELLLQDARPDHSHTSIGHVDDFTAIEIMSGNRPQASAADLAWAIQVFLGSDGLSLKKWSASTFWSDLQKVIGGWFDVASFTIAMPREKMQAALKLLNSPQFAPERRRFSIKECASLIGKLRWVHTATPLGSSSALIGIVKQRRLSDVSDREVKPWGFRGETEALTLAKFHNDIRVNRVFLEAAVRDPSIASCSLMATIKVQERLAIPGQSAGLFWISGDFSMLGQSYGIEYIDQSKGHVKLWVFIEHPSEVIKAIRLALSGGAEKKGYAIVSAVCERQNKLMAEIQFRHLTAGRPGIVLDDNMASVACINAGYSSNQIMQAMQLASNLIQSLDESRRQAYYCTSKNMSWFDQISRQEWAFVEWMNNRLKELGLPTWTRVEPSAQVRELSKWLPKALTQQLPILEELLEAIEARSPRPAFLTPRLDPQSVTTPVDHAWQDRVRAAARDLPCDMGAFGPLAYSIDHLVPTGDTSGRASQPQHPKRLSQLIAFSKTNQSRFVGIDLSRHTTTAGLAIVAGGALLASALNSRIDAPTAALEQSRQTDHASVPICSFAAACLSQATSSSEATELFSTAARVKARAVLIEIPGHSLAYNHAASVAHIIEAAHNNGYSNIAREIIKPANFGVSELGIKVVILAYDDSIPGQPSEPLQVAPWQSNYVSSHIVPSTLVAARLWDTREWTQLASKQGASVKQQPILGWISTSDQEEQATQVKVLHPSSMICGSAKQASRCLYRTLRMRAMCPLYQALCAWAQPIFAASSRSPQVGGLANRRLSAEEFANTKALPADLQTYMSSSELWRYADNSAATLYLTKVVRQLIGALNNTSHCLTTTSPEALVSKQVSFGPGTKPPAPAENPFTTNGSLEEQYEANPDQRQYAFNPIQRSSKLKKHASLYHNLSREELSDTPFSINELGAMAHVQEAVQRAADPKAAASRSTAIKHWIAFCKRAHLPIWLESGTVQTDRVAAAQAELFIYYEIATFDIKAGSVAAKLATIGREHEARRLVDPFASNVHLRHKVAHLCQLDGPPQSKIPVTDATLAVLKQLLDLNKRPSLVLWVGLRFAIALLCRISEWGFNEKHSVTWRCIIFYDKDRNVLHLHSIAQLYLIFEMEVLFYSDKTHNFGQGTARSFFAIPDATDTRCVVRDMATLWLISERDKSYQVFSWNHNTKGPTRLDVSAVLKQAAIQNGIPAADIASHSLRISGLSRLLAAGMPYEFARAYGRWRSDCARRYWWPETRMAQEFSSKLWDPALFARVRGGGEVQYL